MNGPIFILTVGLIGILLLRFKVKFRSTQNYVKVVFCVLWTDVCYEQKRCVLCNLTLTITKFQNAKSRYHLCVY